MVIALLIGISRLLRRGDLLAVPAITLVLLTWLILGLVVVVAWLLRVALPPALRNGHRLILAAGRGLDSDTLGHRLLNRGRHLRHRLRALHRFDPIGRWILARLGPHETGLGLTLAVAIVAATSVGLWALDHQIDQSDSALARIDVRFVDLAANVVVPAQQAVMSTVTVIGDTPTILALVAILLVAAVLARSWHGAAVLVAVPLLASAITTVLKKTEGRARPAFGQLIEPTASWPSGHATGAMALALGICFLAWRTQVRRWPLVAAAVLPIGVLIGYSRAYLTVHWLTDVVAGWLVAALAAGLVATVDILFSRHRAAPRHRGAPRILAVGALIAAGAGAGIALTGRVDKLPEQPTQAIAELTTDRPFAALDTLDDPYSSSLTGASMEPVSLIIAADRATIDAALEEAAFTVADQVTVDRLFSTYRTGLLGDADQTAPVTPTFLGGQMQDLAIQQEIDGVTARHHARLWQLPVRLADGCPVWVATASQDNGVQWTWRTVLPNQRIDPAIDIERDYIAAALGDTSALEVVDSRRLVEPTLGTNAAGDPFFTDGNVIVLAQTRSCQEP